MSRDKQIKLGGLLVVAMALSLIAVFGWGHSQAGTSKAAAHGAMVVDCDASQGGIQSACTYPPGSSFNIEIHITQAPAGGYNSSQAKVEWTEGVVNYLPTVSAADEGLGANCAIPARSNNFPPDPSVLFACTPLPPALFTDTGAFLTFEFQCKGAPENLSPPAGLESNQSLLRLVPRPGDAQQGSHFTDLSNAVIEPEPDLTDATVTCGDVTVPADTPSAPGPTATPQPEIGVSLTSGDTVIEAGGSTVLTFTVVDDLGNTVGAGEVCNFSVVGDATLSSETGTTDANGDVSVTLTAGTTAETVQVTADCGEFGTFVQDVTISPALPATGTALGADSGFSVGLWAMIGALLVAAAAGLTVYGWRSTRAR